MTPGVCDKCWGSGDANKPWPSWRKLEGEERALALELCAAESAYRWTHDKRGAGHMNTGRAWDRMKRASEKLIALLSPGEAGPQGLSR